MIDTLMMAYTVEAVSVEKVMACICQYPSCYPEVETPYDTEDAVTTWINKVSYGTWQKKCLGHKTSVFRLQVLLYCFL